jgi:hypothetical protein
VWARERERARERARARERERERERKRESENSGTFLKDFDPHVNENFAFLVELRGRERH